ncbi:MAG: Smr/MutS family protein [Brevundimonas sp.]|uniref:Smr/MutS family protein n=1 Tax=Brevundimonas sp. TaxID=1871086 RepID=UPI0025C22636|nr:Smr/MutS family protein [Brevundimonas sp.]MBX3476733.1 Smr/MutS family protein [Brevundimonas sp.]
MARRGPPPLSDDDRRLWARVSGTVTPSRRRRAPLAEATAQDPDAPAPKAAPKSQTKGRPAPVVAPPAITRPAPVRAPVRAPDLLEPRRQRRLSRERDPIEARLDLHGYGRFEAEDVLRAFLLSCHARGLRAVLVITGQGRRGGGVIRASFEDWLHAPALRGVVAGFASAHRRHGGAGAVYVTLKRKT